MKKTLIAMAALGAMVGAAQAQSVTVFGIADVSYVVGNASGGAPSLNSVASSGMETSRWGLRGSEDLGGGMKANFHLEGQFNPDNGGIGTASVDNRTAAASALFSRRATVGLSDSWGEIRIGRDLTPSFRNLSAYSPFGTNGVGQTGALFYPVPVTVGNAGVAGTSPRTGVRTSNGISYATPANMGGFSGEVLYAVGESLAAGAASEDGNYLGGRIGYSAGPLGGHLATSTTKYATGDFTQTNLGLRYQMGAAKLMYLYGKNEVGVTSTSANLIGVEYVIGAGMIKAQYTAMTADKIANDATQWAIGYVHNLSKRTALYGTYASLTNDAGKKSTGANSGKAFALDDIGTAPNDLGGNSTGLQIGIRHSF